MNYPCSTIVAKKNLTFHESNFFWNMVKENTLQDCHGFQMKYSVEILSKVSISGLINNDPHPGLSLDSLVSVLYTQKLY